MPRGTRLTDEEKGKIQATFHGENISNGEIARRLEQSPKVINNLALIRAFDFYV